MEYLGNNEVGYRVHTTFEADYNGPSPDAIKQNLVSDVTPFVELTRTSRSMWPNEELVGAKFENDQETVEIEITSSKISIRLDSHSDFDDAYTFLRDRLDANNMDAPSKESFKTQGVTFYCEDDALGISYDETKCSDRDFMGCGYDFRDFEFSYSGIQGMVSFVPTTEDTIVATGTPQFIDAVLRDGILIIGSIDEIESEEE